MGLQQEGHTSSTAGPSYDTTSFTDNSVMILEKCSDCEAGKAFFHF